MFRRRDELVSRFQFVEDHRGAFEVKGLCQVLELNRSSYYKWRADARTLSEREAADAALAAETSPIAPSGPGDTPQVMPSTGGPETPRCR